MLFHLTPLLLIPSVGAVVTLFLPQRFTLYSRPLAAAFATLALIYALGLLTLFERGSSAIQFGESVPWNSRLGTSYSLGIDGFSLPMVLLATLLSLVAILASANILERVKGYFALLLLLESAMLGVFMAQDWALFFLFWELTLIPLFFLINRWGGKRRQLASLNFVLYTMGGSVFMLISLLLLFDAVPGHSFAMEDIALGTHLLPETEQVWIFLGLLIGFGVKMAIFPLHGWLSLAHVEAPSPVSILLSGILLKMGSYGLIRAAMILPLGVMQLQDPLVALALISLVYGGVLAWRQSDLKAMVAYSSISHMGLVLLGIASLNLIGLTGALLQMIAHGLVASLLFLLIGLLYERTHTREIGDYSSLVRVTPRFAFLTSLAFIGAVGLPGTAGFVAELHLLIGGFERWGGWMVILGIGVLIAATYAFRTISRLFTGPIRPQMQGISDLYPSEIVAASTLAGAILLLGLIPAPALTLIDASVTEMASLYSSLP